MSDYVLSCSASCDLNPEWMKRRNIPYVNFNIMVDGEVIQDNMGINLDPRELVKKLQNGSESKTSMVSIGEYVDYFTPFLEEGKDILHVSLSTGISGTFNSARQAADMLKEEYPGRKIIVIDSLAASSGYGLLMDLAADKRDEGLSIDELAAWIEENKLTVIHWFFSTDLSFYIKGGRISKTAGTVGQVLNICPLLNVDLEGRLTPREKIRTKKKVVKRIVEKMIEEADNGLNYTGKVFMSDTDIELGDQVQALIEELFPQLKGRIHRFDIGCTIASHTGPGTVALFFKGKKRDY